MQFDFEGGGSYGVLASDADITGGTGLNFAQFSPGRLNFEGFRGTDVGGRGFESPFSPGVGTPSPDRGFWSELGTGLSKEFTAKPIDALTKSLGIGVTGLGLGNQFRLANQAQAQTNILRQGQKSAMAAAAPAVSAGTANIQGAQAGKLPPQMHASIEEWLEGAIADINARYGAMGLGNSSDLTAEINRAKLAAESMKGTLLQNQEELGRSELQTGVSAATGVAQSAQQQQQTLGQMIAAANQMLGIMQGRQA